VTKAKQKSNSLICILKRLRRLSIEANLSIWQSCVRPVIEYGTGLWWANKTECRKIESIQLVALKHILRVSSKTIDIPVTSDLGVMSLETRRKIEMVT